MGSLEQRIRDRAYQIWLDEGCPEGRADLHWDMASELIVIQDNQKLTLKPLRDVQHVGSTAEPVEPLLSVENAGEFPTLTDQGEENTYPRRGVK